MSVEPNAGSMPDFPTENKAPVRLRTRIRKRIRRYWRRYRPRSLWFALKSVLVLRSTLFQCSACGHYMRYKEAKTHGENCRAKNLRAARRRAQNPRTVNRG